jgi:hypothetical protein
LVELAVNDGALDPIMGTDTSCADNWLSVKMTNAVAKRYFFISFFLVIYQKSYSFYID